MCVCYGPLAEIVARRNARDGSPLSTGTVERERCIRTANNLSVIMEEQFHARVKPQLRIHFLFLIMHGGVDAMLEAGWFLTGRVERALLLHTHLVRVWASVGVQATLKCCPGFSASAAIMFEIPLGLLKMRPRRETEPHADAELA